MKDLIKYNFSNKGWIMRPAPPLIPIAELSVDVLQAILEAGASSSTTQIVSAVRLVAKTAVAA